MALESMYATRCWLRPTTSSDEMSEAAPPPCVSSTAEREVEAPSA